ncbi:MAG: AIM24 family protein [Lachnospiraceae bacterium]|nr:AIM24 family protein [Lachnospiraceae bacterium]
MMDSTCSMDIQSVSGVTNALFGGEGFFNTVISGPGKVILQTMPEMAFAARIAGMLQLNRK